MDPSLVIVLSIFYVIVFGFLGGWIATEKNRNFAEGVLLGVIFGPLGVLIEALMPTLASNELEDRRLKQQQEAAKQFAAEEAAMRKQESQNLAEYDERQRIKQERREEFYRNKGVQPGPFAWFHALPNWLQPILIGLSVTSPIIILFFLGMIGIIK